MTQVHLEGTESARVEGAVVTTPGQVLGMTHRLPGGPPTPRPLAVRASMYVCDLPRFHTGPGPERREARPTGSLTMDR